MSDDIKILKFEIDTIYGNELEKLRVLIGGRI